MTCLRVESPIRSPYVSYNNDFSLALSLFPEHEFYISVIALPLILKKSPYFIVKLTAFDYKSIYKKKIYRIENYLYSGTKSP